MKEEKQALNIELSEEVAEGIYANLVIMAHSSSEFVVDFVRVMPGVSKAKVKSRIVLTPQHAKRLINVLKEHVAKFESLHGQISEGSPNDDGFPMNFGGPTALA